MNLEQIMRLGLTAIVWLVVAILMSIFGLINLFWGVPAMVSWLIIGAGLAGTAVIWSQKGWAEIYPAMHEIETQITQELQKMNKKDMVEMADGLRQLKEKYGIELDLPLGEKQKNDLDVMLSRLSNDELSDIQKRLQSGDLSEEDLTEWLQSNQKVLR
jgi:hypothetical protein